MTGKRDMPDTHEFRSPYATVLDAVQEHAKKSAVAVALLAPGRDPVTYDQLAQSIQATAERIRALGLGPSDRVAVIAENNLEGAVLLLALLSQAVCCPLSEAWAKAEITAYLDTLRPSAVIIPRDAGASVRTLAASSGVPVILASRPGRDGAGVRLEPRDSALAPPPAVSAGEALLLRTSGTTAAGKIVPLSMANILAGASASAAAYRLTAGDRRLNAMPLFHVQGLVGAVITALLAGSSVVCVPAFQPEPMLDQLRSYQITWMSASPAMHRVLLDSAPNSFRSPESLRFVRCGSGALPPVLRGAMEARYGVPVIESYGMSEAHQIASTPMPPGPAAAGMVPTGSRIGFLDQDGVIHAEPGSSGEIVVSGPNVISRYVWPPDAGQNFVAGWLRTGDLGSLAADGSLIITGRVKEIINCGGEKFSPYEIENVLLQHPAVSQAAVFAMPDPALTERSGAAVVLAPGAQVTEQDLAAFVARQVAPYKVPKRILTRQEIPALPSGKMARSSLATVLADELATPAAGAARTTARAPRDAVEATLAGIWALILKRDSVGTDEDFLALGGDSLAAVSLLTMVDEIFSVELPPVTLFDQASTVESMAIAINSARATADMGTQDR